MYDGSENKKTFQEAAHTGGAKVMAEGSTRTVEVVYSPLGVEADALIERLSFENGREDAPKGKVSRQL